MATALVATDFQTKNLANTRNLLGVIQQLRRFDPAVLGEVLAALGAFNAATDLAGQVKAVMTLLKAGVKLTPSTADDKAVAILETVATPELVDVLVRLVGSFVGNSAKVQDATLTTKDRELVSAKAIPWGFLVQLAMQIAQLVEQLSRKNAAAVAAPVPPKSDPPPKKPA